MIEKILERIGSQYALTEKTGNEFSTFKAQGMTFVTHAYEVKGLGHVSVMCASGFFGLMKMDTLIVCPEEKDLPLLSYDRIYAMGNDTLFLELYDTTLAGGTYADLDRVNETYAALPNRILKKEETHWYDDIRLPQTITKKGKKKETDSFDAYTLAYFNAYLNMSAAACNVEEKQKKNSLYAEGLLANGGPATDVLRKQLGEEKTAKLLRTVLFGTQK
ncbi:MAG: hypothetical protein IJW96_01490 [Clostridia bacterium]|nr:hypothetical protein [Clostridia bacterium]